MASAVYLHGKRPSLEHIITILERSGNDRKTLFVQEQAARTLCYLTEGKVVSATLRKSAEKSSSSSSGSASDNNNNNGSSEYGNVEMLDLPRAVRALLDHASASNKNPNLQRWSTACIRNLVVEDQRRACLAINDLAAYVASGESTHNKKLDYESFMSELITTGGVMILCSLIGADDADTRAHAVGALGATLTSTRAVDSSMSALHEMTGGVSGRTTRKDMDIVNAIVAGGGTASSVAQLLLSADNAVAGMGCTLLAALVMPLLSDPSAMALTDTFGSSSSSGSQVDAYREAALEIATGSCLPALLSLAREPTGRATSRPMELRRVAMETLAAVVSSIGEMALVWAHGQYEEGLERADAPTKLKEAVMMLNEEQVTDAALSVLQSGTGQSLGTATTAVSSSGGSRETPSARIREAAGIVLGSLSSCSAEAIMNLQTKATLLSTLLLASTDANMTVPSTLRGDSAPRCLGVLDTVASVMMFAWQHPSGAASELLDRLIEVLDAGAIPYLSRVLNTKVEWDSRDKAVGGMKGRAAACRLLCCLFGIALTDSTGIGLRRLMDAVELDARSYRSTNNDRAPTNIVEAALATLQTSSNMARQAVLGTLSTPIGPLYQSALMALVDAALLAAGSMCGSSVAPGGSEGILITGETFLSVRNDQYVGRRQEICNVACDVIVRSARGLPPVLPTMLVGGFGEAAVLSSLRLALAIAQNGTQEQHAKLALSGILVPVSDSLRTALSGGDLYKFSAALALVRFCGPHVAAGQGGGVESVRDAIRVATNVLTLPVNPEATIEQIETQEALKSECISALESLSKNASLWNAISTDALPSMVSYLHMSATMSSSDPRRQKTRSAALRAVLQIVQVPSHAVSAAAAGLVGALGKLLVAGTAGSGSHSDDDEVPMLALEVLHVISLNPQARRQARMLDTGLVRSICAAVGRAATDTPKKPSDSRADVTFLGLEILNSVVVEGEGGLPTEQVLQSPYAIAFLDAVAAEPRFVRALCSTSLVMTKMKIPRHDSDTSGEESVDIPRLHGPPLILVPETCAGRKNTHEAAASLLFTTAVYACAIESKRSDAFWKSVFLQDIPQQNDPTGCTKAAAALSAHLLALLTMDYPPFIPLDGDKQQDYLALTRPLVRHRLLEALRDFIVELSGEVTYGPKADPYVTSLLVGFNIPHICLSLWKDPALLDLAFGMLRQIVEQDPDEVLHLFVAGKPAIMSLFDLLNIDGSIDTAENVGEIKRFLASVLAQLAENGLLKDAVERFDVRSSAISALAAACLGEEERPADDDEDTTSNRLSSVLMRCLVDLCMVESGLKGAKKRIQLSSSEALTMAQNLGKKICQMVLSRFLERAKLQQYQIEEDEDIMTAPDVAMLCAIAQHNDALLELRSIGGLHALSLVAAEGEITALTALKKACTGDANILLEGDTYKAMMKLIVSNDHSDHDSPLRFELQSLSLDLLARLCLGSAKARSEVANSEHIQDCILRAIHVVSSLVVSEERTPKGSDAPGEAAAASDESAVEEKEPSTIAAGSTRLPRVDLLGQSNESLSNLGAAACAFLSSLAPTHVARKALREDSGWVDAVAHIAVSATPELRFAALSLLSTLAPYTVRDGKLSPACLADVFKAVLLSEERIEPSETVNGNRVHQSAAVGLAVIFDELPTDTQKALGLAVSKRFALSVKGCVVVRSNSKVEERSFAAELMYGLTLCLLSVRGKGFVDDVCTQELITSLMQLVQWRYDPKTTVDNNDQRMWDAAVSNCLLLLSTLVWRPDEVLLGTNVNLQALAGTTLMLARPGKAPRKAIDVKSALQHIVDAGDAAAATSAQRLLDRLF